MSPGVNGLGDCIAPVLAVLAYLDGRIAGPSPLAVPATPTEATATRAGT